MTIPGNILPDLWTQCHALQVVRAAEEHLRQHPDEIPTVVVDMPYSMIVLDTRECVLTLTSSTKMETANYSMRMIPSWDADFVKSVGLRRKHVLASEAPRGNPSSMLCQGVG